MCDKVFPEMLFQHKAQRLTFWLYVLIYLYMYCVYVSTIYDIEPCLISPMHAPSLPTLTSDRPAAPPMWPQITISSLWGRNLISCRKWNALLHCTRIVSKVADAQAQKRVQMRHFVSLYICLFLGQGLRPTATICLSYHIPYPAKYPTVFVC